MFWGMYIIRLILATEVPAICKICGLLGLYSPIRLML